MSRNQTQLVHFTYVTAPVHLRRDQRQKEVAPTTPGPPRRAARPARPVIGMRKYSVIEGRGAIAATSLTPFTHELRRVVESARRTNCFSTYALGNSVKRELSRF
ncbi:hypothetical protein EVAR_55937_1 [Eumeta japonica]|uniref:Uncharacterized protein n=1 Tax=Eumeta variegata TaxID=151549 RepID=A0A4C1YZS8_EUMVA|nr:hypothetical protein EVAR_55937_1 [Eumeta japonica]